MSAAVVVLSAASSPPDFRQHLHAFLSSQLPTNLGVSNPF